MAAPEITDRCAQLTLADVDDEGISLQVPDHTVDDGVEDDGFYAVGRLVTDKPVRFAYFQDTMAGVWRPAVGVNMRELQPRKFLFRFYHDGDLTRILNDGPWTYDQSLLLMKRVQEGVDLESIPLTHADFWVQIHSLPVGLRSASVVMAIGSFLGTFVSTDERNFDGGMQTFYRVRVSLDVVKPLKKQMKLKRDSGEWAVVDFKYERLPKFCFLCGVIGHGDRFCLKALQDCNLNAVKPYGSWLRVNPGRALPNQNQCWIPPESTIERRRWISPVMAEAASHTVDIHGEGSEIQGDRTTCMQPTVSMDSDELPILNIGDQKRRRVLQSASIGQASASVSIGESTYLDNNGVPAGLAVQARQDQ
ncbi:PREDICTED: uncharacterized protein LOC109174935 [Ipomoea nil]|uniref:uncharacterized protein LOC109174935 n=1 Tax=Ipomoea nil TaxID=35883 RepID=UPI000901B8D3|nr:PREDICTED: uncharacterized protein LOC109174935 [Ipomoea nil]